MVKGEGRARDRSEMEGSTEGAQSRGSEIVQGREVQVDYVNIVTDDVASA